MAAVFSELTSSLALMLNTMDKYRSTEMAPMKGGHSKELRRTIITTKMVFLAELRKFLMTTLILLTSKLELQRTSISKYLSIAIKHVELLLGARSTD